MSKTILDEILERFIFSFTHKNDPMDLAQTEQSILDWHNKQVEAVLDRLESQLQDPNNVDFYDESNNSLMNLDEWLLLERNKLKEGK